MVGADISDIIERMQPWAKDGIFNSEKVGDIRPVLAEIKIPANPWRFIVNQLNSENYFPMQES